jgi:FkbM family methyltransferase
VKSFTLDINGSNYKLLGLEDKNVYESHLKDLSLYKCIDYDCVIDIGANIGITTLFFAQLSSEVFAFEPNLDSFNVLVDNLKLNRISNVSPVNLGCGNKRMSKKLVKYSQNRSSDFILTNSFIPHTDYDTESIDLVNLDHFVNKQKLAKIDLIKIDVEGYELSVLAGSIKTLRFFQPVVILEMNSFCLNVLHSVALPTFVTSLKRIFPILFAIDGLTFLDLHSDNDAYHVMYEHVVNKRYFTVLGCFTEAQISKFKKQFTYGA